MKAEDLSQSVSETRLNRLVMLYSLECKYFKQTFIRDF